MLSLIIQYGVQSAMVFIFVALGGMLSERSGIINIGLDGIMVIGALAGSITMAALAGTMAPWLILLVAVVVAMIAGCIFSQLLAIAAVKFKADQTIAGMALNILSVAIAVLVVRMYLAASKVTVSFNNSGMSFNIGSVNISYLIFVCVIAIVVVWLFINKTKTGLRLTACGEHPQAADSVGVNVYRMRFLGVALSGILGGIGGLAYIVSGNNWNATGGVGGMGFLALAVMIFGQWRTIKIVLASILFGILRGVALMSSQVPALANLFPSFVWSCMPYIVCLIVLALTSKSSRAPKAEGIIYDKGQR